MRPLALAPSFGSRLPGGSDRVESDLTYWEPDAGKRRFAAPARRFGYTATAAINAALLWVANRLLDWEWPAFLTQDFDEVLPILSASLVAAIAVNLAYLFYDPPWFGSATQVLLSVIGLAVVIQTLGVFPFDFSAYEFPWETTAEVILVIAIVGTSIGIVTELVRLARHATKASMR